MDNHVSTTKSIHNRGRLGRAISGALLVAGLLMIPAQAASADVGAQDGDVDGGTGAGVSVGVEWAETTYDTEIGWTVHVSVDGPATGYDSPYNFRANVFTYGSGGGTAQVGPDGGDMTITGTIASAALEQDAHVRVAVYAVNAFGYDVESLYDQTFNLGYVDRPASIGIQTNAWDVAPDGIWWAVTVNWDSLAGAVDEVCSDELSECRGALLAETADGTSSTMQYHASGYDYTDIGDLRFGSGDRLLTNVGGGALPLADYVAIYWRVSGTARNGDAVRIESPHIAPSAPGDFVYVALGDSYQSGEGAGNSYADTSSYLNVAYENGTNYPGRVGGQQNTYTPNLLTGGNGCHRALEDYAKTNANRLEPGSMVTLIDVTCSGAEIEPGGSKPPIVGTVGEGLSPSSQVNQAILRLREAGLDPADVDLVTVGMGGNDAGFGDIVKQCAIPSLIERLIDLYPGTPSEIGFIDNVLVSCSNADRILGHTDEAINALQAKEEWAQQQLLLAFPNARIQQVDYPDVLPEGSAAPAWCGGMRKEDLDFARSRVAKINTAIRNSVAATNSPRLELVELEGVFGDNSFCPGCQRRHVGERTQRTKRPGGDDAPAQPQRRRGSGRQGTPRPPRRKLQRLEAVRRERPQPVRRRRLRSGRNLERTRRRVERRLRVPAEPPADHLRQHH